MPGAGDAAMLLSDDEDQVVEASQRFQDTLGGGGMASSLFGYEMSDHRKQLTQEKEMMRSYNSSWDIWVLQTACSSDDGTGK